MREERSHIICMRPFLAVIAAVTLAVSASALPASHAAGPLVVLVYGGKTYEYTDEYPDPPDFTVAEEYEERGINEPMSERMDKVESLISGGCGVKAALLWCFPLLADTVARAKTDIELTAEDAEMRFDQDATPMFEIKRSCPGLAVDETRLYTDVYFALRRGLHRVAVNVVAVLPSVTAEDLAACTRLRSRFETSYASSVASRRHNIELAMSRIGGTVLAPGEEFSFNAQVGRRTKANGFEEAKIIVGGEYTDGVGGGVCQASTTLYNAALLAGMKITAVSRHTLVPSYVEPSFDAMVNGSGSDLKFVNDGEDPVYVRAYAKNGKAVAEFYSSALPYKISRRSVTVKTGKRPADREFVDVERRYTDGLLPGEKVRVSGGAPAVSSEGYLIKTYPNGRTESVLLRRDSYAEAAGRVAVAPESGGKENADDK